MSALLRRILVAGSLLVLAICQDTCTPVRDSCDFYPCLDTIYKCGADGYPLGYGNKFCTAFKDSRSEFSPKGQQWISDVMFCLQTALQPFGSSATVDCEELSGSAFASHAKCYVDTGFCTLPPSDWLKVVEIVGLKTLLEKETILAELETAGQCLEAFIFLQSLI
ncbi:hypothetical protein BDZ89DRAFT_408299 [Hymenopellis radicata]|nr:hypothetical protein BDZ89DRAFT_408299 [Hymenopellis radicata]